MAQTPNDKEDLTSPERRMKSGLLFFFQGSALDHIEYFADKHGVRREAPVIDPGPNLLRHLLLLKLVGIELPAYKGPLRLFKVHSVLQRNRRQLCERNLTVALMCPAMSFLAAFLYYPSYAGFNMLTFLANWIKLVCFNFPFALLSQLLFIQPLVRTIFKAIIKTQSWTNASANVQLCVFVFFLIFEICIIPALVTRRSQFIPP